MCRPRLNLARFSSVARFDSWRTRRNGTQPHGRLQGRTAREQWRAQWHHPRLIFVLLRDFALHIFRRCNGSGGGRGCGRRLGSHRVHGGPLHALNPRLWRSGGILVLLRPGQLRARRGLVGGGEVPAIVTAQAIRQVVINRAGMTKLFGSAEFGKFVEYFSRLHFQLASQLVYADLTHTEAVRFLPIPDYFTRQSFHYTKRT